MKKIIYTTICFIALFAMNSCKKTYLNLEPVNNYSYYNFAQNESQIEQAVVGCYRKLVPIYSSHIWFFGDMLSDNTSFRYNPSDRGGIETEKVEEFVGNANESQVVNMYRECYEAIGRSNYVLENLTNITFQSDSVKKIREGEALFFRAFHYFNLVRLYGDVPVVLKSVLEPDAQTATNYPRKPVATVYNDVIVPDVTTAINNLPQTVPAAQKGRLTKDAARVLLAKVLMTQNKFADALTILNQVIGYSLNPIYANNFNPATKNGIESIFEVQTLDVASGGFTFSFMSQWTPWGTGTTIWPNGSNSRGGLNQPTADLNAAYELTDNRKAVTVGSSGTGAAAILFMRKFLYHNAATQSNPCNWPVYRWADVLLMQAECLNEASFPSAAAFTALNAVRTRAGLPSKSPTSPVPALQVLSQADMRLAIEKERRVEFAGEGHRWFDLLRTSRVVPVMTAHGAQEAMLKATTMNAGAYSQIKTLIGIPFREIQQFGYPQNSGW